MLLVANLDINMSELLGYFLKFFVSSEKSWWQLYATAATS
jgi:hypothetical protein